MQELEAKFLTAAGQSPDDVVRRFQETLAWAGFRVQPRGRRTVRDTYFDTPSQELRGAGWSYRRRDDAQGPRIALKEINRSRGAVFDRQEIEQPIADDEDLRRPQPGPVQERLSNLLHPDARLVPLFSVRSQRAAYRLSHPDHPRGLVEMAFDHAAIDAAASLEFTELELELKDGSHELLASVLAAAELEPSLLDARLSRYERGLIAADAVPGKPATGHGLNRRSRWADVGVAHLKAQLTQLRLFEPYAWEGIHPEGVHQMRVATRRARAALRSFADVLPRRETDELAPRLRWLAARLGAVRDLDVHLEHVADYRQALEPDDRASLDHYETHLLDLRAEAHRSLVAALAGDEYPELLHHFRQLIRTAVHPEHVSTLRVEDVARAAVAPLLTRVLERGRTIDADSEAERLHRLRIDVKRLRYQLEALEGACDGAVTHALQALRKLQDRLGNHQDACVARTHLARYRKVHAADKTERRTFKRLVTLEKKRARRQRKRFPRDWQRFEAAVDTLLEQL